jgi:two-component system, sporulation sensor kinase E
LPGQATLAPRLENDVKSGFLDKLIDRIDKVDAESLQAHFLHLAQDRGLLETIFQSIQEGVLVLDRRGVLSYTNHAAEQLLGFSHSDVVGRPIAHYVRGIDWERVLDLDEDEWARLISREIEISYPEYRIVSFYVVPLPGSEAADKGAVVILRDVTKDRMAEESTLNSERTDAIKLLAAGVAHEIGNPLNALNIHLQLLERETNEVGRSLEGEAPFDRPELCQQVGELSELVDIAKNEVARLDLIITQFLKAIRPSRPNVALARIEDLLEETLTLLRHEVQDREIDVQIECPLPMPEIRVDKDQIKQAFFNIIRNAFQAMPDGGMLGIGLTSDSEYVRLAFSDTGVGIPPERMRAIFDPYVTTKPEGSGLGLMIVQRIIQEHGGEIELVSKAGTGTRFLISLPRAARRIRLLDPAPDAATTPFEV